MYLKGRPIFFRSFGLYCSACFGSLFVSIPCTCCSHFVGPLHPFEDFTSILVSPGYVTGPSQGESSGGAATLLPLDLHAFL